MGNCANVRLGNCIGGTSDNDILVKSTTDDGIFINLTQETIYLGDFVPTHFSIKEGKWTALKAGDKSQLAAANFLKLLKKDLTLKLKNGDVEIEFPKINKRRTSSLKLVVNYKILAANSPTGAIGGWTLAEKKTTTATTADIEVGIANYGTDGLAAKPGKTPLRWGELRGTGICVAPLPVNNKAAKTVYFYRESAFQSGTAVTPVYTAGSKPKKVSATSLNKPIKAVTKNGKLKVKAGTFIDGVEQTAGSVDVTPGQLVWMGADKKAATSPATAT
ncbi:MAG: hypothetical protein FWH04_08805 [Oscillospiraceae bacterium]|nr:hypothetical protein [Oscillospiraceae bacterium]